MTKSRDLGNYGTAALADTGSGANNVITADASGNVGIGVVPETWFPSLNTTALQIGDTTSIWSLTNGAGDLRTSLDSNLYIDASGNDKYLNTGPGTRYQQIAGEHRWSSAASGTADSTATVSDRMRIDSSGNVGIGTISPSRALSTKSPSVTVGSFESTSGSGGLVSFSDANTTNDVTVRAGASGNDLVLQAGGVERMRLDSAGSLLVGTTTLADVNGLVTSHLLEGGSSVGGNGAVGVYNNTGSANAPALMVLNRDVSTDSTNRFVQFNASVTSSGSQAMGAIVGNGVNNAQFAATSDIREKTNIESITDSLVKIKSLRPVEFDWIESGEHCKAGFVAQEVETVFPEFVVENMARDGEEERKGLTGGMTGGIIPHLVKAIQEQQTLIEALTARIEALEAK